MKRLITIAGITAGVSLLAAGSVFAATSSTGSVSVKTALMQKVQDLRIEKGTPGIAHLTKAAKILTTTEDRTAYVNLLKSQRESIKTAIEGTRTKYESAHTALENQALSEFAASGSVSTSTTTALKALNEKIMTETRTAMEAQKTSFEAALKAQFGDTVATELLPQHDTFKKGGERKWKGFKGRGHEKREGITAPVAPQE